VLFPALGFPMIFTNPDRMLAAKVTSSKLFCPY
jgi:hypothetical protein